MKWKFISGLLLASGVWAQVNVDTSRTIGPMPEIWRFFGYDEPNYTYTPNGKKLIGELATLGKHPVYIRTHFMLATGDGTASLKWGSTNAYTEDAHGKPVYDWTIVDRILDTYLDAGAKPFVEIGFMPKALSSHPDPYNVEWIPGAPNKEYSAGWSYPPKDFAKWSDVVYHWVAHEVAKHGAKEVASWYWEVWNEPDISYWHGTPEEYDRLYDSAVAAVKKALPTARVGGPASTGPGNEKAAAFLTQFLQHCQSAGVPLDFISYHAKGQPTLLDGKVRMGMAKHLRDVENGFKIINAFPKFAHLPIVLTESDPEGCAACSARVYPQNAYRNGALYGAYTVDVMKNILDMAARSNNNIEGMLTWAFEFENQPSFDGFRTLATNGIDKPVLNAFRILGKMQGQRVAVDSDTPALAARGDHEASLVTWAYQSQTTHVKLTNLPNGPVTIHRFLVDDNHSNAWTVWKAKGSDADILKAGQLFEENQQAILKDGSFETDVTTQGDSITLVQVTW